jgi:transposase
VGEINAYVPVAQQRGGAPSKLDAEMKNEILAIIEAHPSLTLREITDELRRRFQDTKPSVSKSTINKFIYILSHIESH